VPLINYLAEQRWYERYGMLNDTDGPPTEIYVFGFSGDEQATHGRWDVLHLIL
jgi:hypothetical protein